MKTISPEVAKERPIIFTGESVRAILEGRKTQTRRVIAGNPELTTNAGFAYDGRDGKRWCCGKGMSAAETLRNFTSVVRCRYGQPGDRLWVKEAIRLVDAYFLTSEYAADGALTPADAWPWKLKTLPPMFCPRGLSRITLEITDVRLQRLQEISEEDARAEGAKCADRATGREVLFPDQSQHIGSWKLHFREIWDSINAKRAPWASNPWVWCLTFRRIKP